MKKDGQGRRTVTEPKSRIICLPHAGGSAATFASWQRGLDDGIELYAVQYPGRGSRSGEEPITEPEAMIAALIEEIGPLTGIPYVLFGHSLGALLAFEAARGLRERGCALPCAMMLSSCRPPIRLPSSFVVDAVNLPDSDFLNQLSTLGGVPETLCDEPALRELLLSATRSDFELVSRYRYSAQARLDVPAVLLYGADDHHVDGDMLSDWRCEFVDAPEVRKFPGGHFYFEEPEAAQAIQAEIRSRLTPQTIVSVI